MRRILGRGETRVSPLPFDVNLGRSELGLDFLPQVQTRQIQYRAYQSPISELEFCEICSKIPSSSFYWLSTHVQYEMHFTDPSKETWTTGRL